MTTAQKVIKYAATAFAIFLIVNIMSAILIGLYIVGNIFGLVNSTKNTITEDLNAISGENTEISTLKIDLGFTDLHIKTGEEFKVETNNSNISYKENNGRVIIKEENFKWSGFNHNTESKLIIYLPKDRRVLNEVKIKGGAGTVNIDSLKVEELHLEVGAGEVKIENVNVNVSKELKIDGGAGKTELEHSEVNNLDANLGVGEFTYSGILTGNTDIDSGIGNIKINLTDDIKNYTIDIDKGLGNVTIDGKNIETNRVHGTGKQGIKIDGGVGNINIDFEKGEM